MNAQLRGFCVDVLALVAGGMFVSVCVFLFRPSDESIFKPVCFAAGRGFDYACELYSADIAGDWKKVREMREALDDEAVRVSRMWKRMH